MMKRLVIAPLLALILAACRAQPPLTPTITTIRATHTWPPPTVTEEPRSANPWIASSSVPSSPLPETTPTPWRSQHDLPPGPTPSLPPSLDYREFLFANNSCELPCWQDLSIGESTADDVQQVFDRSLGLEGYVDFFDPGPFLHYASAYLIEGRQPQGYYMVGYSWTTIQGEIFSGGALLDIEDTLAGLTFRMFDPQKPPNPSLSLFMDRLGVPDYWSIGWDRERVVSAEFPPERSTMVWEFLYEEGVYIKMDIRSPVIPLDNEESQLGITICEQAETQVSNIFLTSPYTDLQELAPNQILPDSFRGRFLSEQHVEDAFGMSKNEVMAHFLASDDACLTTR